jgi:hypothetical protein
VLWVASAGSDRVLGFDAEGGVVAELGAGSGLFSPHGVAIGPTGNILTGDLASNTILEFTPAGAHVGTWGAGAGLLVPSDLVFGADGHLFVASAGTGRVTEFDAAGALVRELGADSSLVLAIGLAFGADGLLRVSSGAGNSVVVLDAEGDQAYVFTADLGLAETAGVAVGPDGLLYVVCRTAGIVAVLDAEGTLLQQLGAGSGLLLAGDIAFAPRRFPVTLSGHFMPVAGKSVKLKQTGVLSVRPGSQELGLALNGIGAVAAGDTPLAALLGSPSLLLRGFQTTTDESDELDVQGVLRVGGQRAVSLTLLLHLTGAESAAGAFMPAKAKGELWGGARDGQARATLKVGKPLN